MNFKTLCMVKAIACIVFGIAFVVVPTPVIDLFGVTLTPGGAVVTQLFGSSFIVISLILWFAKGVEASDARDAITLAVCVGDLVGCIVAIIGVVGGPMNALGWLVVALYLLLGVGFGYLRFMKRAAA